MLVAFNLDSMELIGQGAKDYVAVLVDEAINENGGREDRIRVHVLGREIPFSTKVVLGG